jgi:2-methylisocitrate lyase-like PEP mutase family enzyme
MSARQSLRERLGAGFLVAPAISDGFTALIAQRAGFQACYVAGDDLAAQRGFPDVGLTNFGELLDDVRYVSEAVAIPTIAEPYAPFADELHVARVVREYESAGASGLLIDDYASSPVGFDGDRQVLSQAEAVAKVDAALGARSDPNVVIIAGTAALATNGWADTLERVKAYRESGADMVFIDKINGLADLEHYASEVASDGPTMYKGLLVPTSQVRKLGFALAISGSAHVLSLVAVRDALLRARTGGGSERVRDELRFDEITSLLGLDRVYALEAKYSTDRTEGSGGTGSEI